MKIKYVIGTHIMFYEIELLDDYLNGLLNAVAQKSEEDDIIIDFTINMSQVFEKLDFSLISEIDLTNKFIDKLNEFERAILHYPGVRKNHRFITMAEKNPYTMTDYRRWLNDYYCDKVDYIVWGETDCLAPQQFFFALRQVKEYANAHNLHKYITTFATRKMWDESWKILEHPEFTNLPYYEKSDQRAFTSPHSIRYNMSVREMNEINEKQKTLGILLIEKPKFDGSFLVISSDLIKMGCNIPRGIFGLSGEDTSFMYSCMKLLGRDYRQFVIKNILKVHNREHPRKRNYALDIFGDDASTQNKKGGWFNLLRFMNKNNLDLYQNDPQSKFLTWDDFFEQVKKG